MAGLSPMSLRASTILLLYTDDGQLPARFEQEIHLLSIPASHRVDWIPMSELVKSGTNSETRSHCTARDRKDVQTLTLDI